MILKIYFFLKRFIFFLLCHLYLSSSILMIRILLGWENANSWEKGCCVCYLYVEDLSLTKRVSEMTFNKSDCSAGLLSLRGNFYFIIIILMYFCKVISRLVDMLFWIIYLSLNFKFSFVFYLAWSRRSRSYWWHFYLSCGHCLTRNEAFT